MKSMDIYSRNDAVPLDIQSALRWHTEGIGLHGTLGLAAVRALRTFHLRTEGVTAETLFVGERLASRSGSDPSSPGYAAFQQRQQLFLARMNQLYELTTGIIMEDVATMPPLESMERRETLGEALRRSFRW